jgi:hypothetical protein
MKLSIEGQFILIWFFNEFNFIKFLYASKLNYKEINFCITLVIKENLC